MLAEYKRHWSVSLVLLLLLLLPESGVQAQDSKVQASLEQVDPEFASLVKEWTTKPEFMSPLVDHLPKKPGVPTPKDILGRYIGEPKKLAYTADQQRFFRALESALPGR